MKDVSTQSSTRNGKDHKLGAKTTTKPDICLSVSSPSLRTAGIELYSVISPLSVKTLCLGNIDRIVIYFVLTSDNRIATMAISHKRSMNANLHWFLWYYVGAPCKNIAHFMVFWKMFNLAIDMLVGICKIMENSFYCIIS